MSARTPAAAASSHSRSHGPRPKQRHTPPPTESMSPGDAARLLLLAGLWGCSFAFMRVAVSALGPLWLAFSRVVLAFFALFVLSLARLSFPPHLVRYRGYLLFG